MSLCKDDTPKFMDNEGQTWDSALWMTLLVFIYIYRDDMNIERLIPCSNKDNLHLKNIPSINSKSKQQSTFNPSNKVGQVAVAITMPCTIWSSAIFSVFFIDAINWKFAYLYLLPSLG